MAIFDPSRALLNIIGKKIEDSKEAYENELEKLLMVFGKLILEQNNGNTHYSSTLNSVKANQNGRGHQVEKIKDGIYLLERILSQISPISLKDDPKRFAITNIENKAYNNKSNNGLTGFIHSKIRLLPDNSLYDIGILRIEDILFSFIDQIGPLMEKYFMTSILHSNQLLNESLIALEKRYGRQRRHKNKIKILKAAIAGLESHNPINIDISHLDDIKNSLLLGTTKMDLYRKDCSAEVAQILPQIQYLSHDLSNLYAKSISININIVKLERELKTQRLSPSTRVPSTVPTTSSGSKGAIFDIKAEVNDILSRKTK